MAVSDLMAAGNFLHTHAFVPNAPLGVALLFSLFTFEVIPTLTQVLPPFLWQRSPALFLLSRSVFPPFFLTTPSALRRLYGCPISEISSGGACLFFDPPSRVSQPTFIFVALSS